MRPAIALLLACTCLIGGCDRQSQVPPQANDTNLAPAAPADGGNAGVVHETIGTLERGHKGEETLAGEGFEDPAGREVTLADFRGKPVLLNLWATWCVPCVAEMPTLDRLAEMLDGQVQVLVVSQDLEGKAKVDPYFRKAGFKRLQPYLDTDAGLGSLINANLPTTILYDSQGREVWRMLGGMDWTGETARELIAEAR